MLGIYLLSFNFRQHCRPLMLWTARLAIVSTFLRLVSMAGFPKPLIVLQKMTGLIVQSIITIVLVLSGQWNVYYNNKFSVLVFPFIRNVYFEPSSCATYMPSKSVRTMVNNWIPPWFTYASLHQNYLTHSMKLYVFTCKTNPKIGWEDFTAAFLEFYLNRYFRTHRSMRFWNSIDFQNRNKLWPFVSIHPTKSQCAMFSVREKLRFRWICFMYSDGT